MFSSYKRKAYTKYVHGTARFRYRFGFVAKIWGLPGNEDSLTID